MSFRKFKATISIEMTVEGFEEEEAYKKVEKMREPLGHFPGVKIKLVDITAPRAYSIDGPTVIRRKLGI